jgi:heme exporter protein D
VEGQGEMVFVWLTAFFLVVALIVLVIYQVREGGR